MLKSMRDYYKQGAGFEMISSEILIAKIAERIEAILSGNAPDLDELEAEEAAEESDKVEVVAKVEDDTVEETAELIENETIDAETETADDDADKEEIAAE